MVTSDRVLMTDYQRDVAGYWNSHTNDPVNLELGKVDGIYHHHYGIGEADLSVLEAPAGERDAHRAGRPLVRFRVVARETPKPRVALKCTSRVDPDRRTRCRRAG